MNKTSPTKWIFMTVDRASSVTEEDHGIVTKNRPVHTWQLAGWFVWDYSYFAMVTGKYSWNQSFSLKMLNCSYLPLSLFACYCMQCFFFLRMGWVSGMGFLLLLLVSLFSLISCLFLLVFVVLCLVLWVCTSLTSLLSSSHTPSLSVSAATVLSHINNLSLLPIFSFFFTLLRSVCWFFP